MIGSSSVTFPKEIVDRISKHLSNGKQAALDNISDILTPSRNISLSEFLEKLFVRAPGGMLRTRTADDLATIVSGALEALSHLSKQADRIVLNFSRTEDGGTLFVALDDHPFIISSISETLSDADIKVGAFLHPIIHFSGAPIALSYIEIVGDSAEHIPQLLPKIREILTNLSLVGRDFAPMRAATADARKSLKPGELRTNFGVTPHDEAAQFLDWLNDGCFFFLGVTSGTTSKGPLTQNNLGVWRSTSPYAAELLKEVSEDIECLHSENLDLSIRKLRLISNVHRHATLVHIVIRTTTGEGTCTSITGYLTSKAWAHEAHDIPILRQKVAQVVSQEGAIPNSHDYKYIVEVIDNMPTDEALAAPVEELVNLTRLALQVFSQEESLSCSSIDQLGRRALTTVILPPDRYSAAVQSSIQNVIESTFQATPYSSEVHIDSSKKRQFRLYISTPLPISSHKPHVPAALSEEIIKLTLPWEDSLRSAVEQFELPFSTDGVFPNDYRAATDIAEATHDALLLSKLSDECPLATSLYMIEALDSPSTLSIFSSKHEVSISLAAPVLENVGLEVLSAHSYECRGPRGATFLLKLAVRPYDGETLQASAFNGAVSPGLAKILAGEAPNDALNLLLRKVPVTIQEISLLRSYCALLWQVSKISTKRTMWEALAGAPHVALQLCRIFDWKFNPAHALASKDRLQRTSLEESVLTEALRQVPDITKDRVLRALLALLRASVRTNFYTGSDTLAIKLRSQEIEFMPHPRPLFEIFVFSSRIEGTHLRSARVARGGIRWSERVDDYRSEVLGLMKTQKVKNVIIVPSGAKGGFIVKNLPKQPEAIPKAVETGYREYITALLTLADTKENDSVIHPANVVLYDEPDPYFVVAADKGTATFSDVANSIAQEKFNFWLGDAFASGGSAGYDHKKHGITARGGWECVTRHFRDLGINYTEEPFSVVGLGDMSGDVFGNGLMLSRNMSLVAAFNHKHIFIDPKPDVSRTFEERARLFSLPRSQWSDFNASIISRGGGVFNRFDKEISLTPEIREALSIPEDVPGVVDGERLISLILQAQVDLIWNGGIGTYVKARSESHADVNDGTNDGVRINADELRARVVGEGGNLGLTQKARVEFSQRGGRINTDAIDNSGGVDLSDHEVNLKLLLSPIVKASRLSLASRNELLSDIAPNVVTSVLTHNRDQALMLTTSQTSSCSSMEQYRYLIRDMHRRGYLDRNRDSLPDEAEIDERSSAKTGLTRPELAICSAAIKMWIKDEIRSTNLCADKSLEPFLLEYFPPKIQEQFRPEVLSHPLRNDIIASEIINTLLPVTGISFIHSLVTMNGTSVPTAMKCILAADTILGARELREQLRTLDTSRDASRFAHLWRDMGVAVREASNWLLITHGATLSLQEMAQLYADIFRTLSTHSAMVFTGKELPRFERRVTEYRELGASEQAATTLALYRRILPVLEMLWSAREFASDVRVVAGVFSQVLEELRVNELFKFENILETSSKWEQELVVGSYQEIRRSVSMITGQLVQKQTTETDKVQAALQAASGYEAIKSTMTDIEELLKQKRPFQVAALPVITRQLRLFRA